MSIEIVNNKDLYNILQNVNLVKVKFPSEDTWVIAPVLYSTEETLELIVDALKLSNSEVSKENTIMKFQRQGFEYLVSGNIIDLNKSNFKTVTIKFKLAQRVNNQRKYVRFDTNLKVLVKKDNGAHIESIAKNISRGGAMIVSKADLDLNSSIGIKIEFESGNHFNAISKILRKSPDKCDCFSYGIEFMEINEDDSVVINKEISKYEKEYLKSLSILREYTKKDDICFNTKITILCYDKDEGYEIREALVKLGAENFDILHDFKFYAGYFIEEKPKIVVLDIEDISVEIVEMIKCIIETFPEVYVVILLPIDYMDDTEAIGSLPENVVMLYKPLIFDELEREMIKYL